MLSTQQLIANNKALLNGIITEENQVWVNLLIQLGLTQRDLITLFIDNFHIKMAADRSHYTKDDVEEDFIRLLKALNNLKSLKTEDPNTVLNKLINDFIGHSVNLANTIIKKDIWNHNHLQADRKTNFKKLTTTVNNTSALIESMKMNDGNTNEAAAALINSADEMQSTLSGPLVLRSPALAAIIGISILLVGAALLASPFGLMALGCSVPAILLTAAGGALSGIFTSIAGCVFLAATLTKTESNNVVDQTTRSAKMFTQHSAALFAPKAKIGDHKEKIEMQTICFAAKAA